MKKNNFENRNGLSIMKKILIISLFMMLTYCNNEAKDEVNDESTFNIPSWIIGTWSNDDGTNKWIFSSDNIVEIEYSTTADLKAETVAGTFTVIDKMSTDTSYTLEGTHVFESQKENEEIIETVTTMMRTLKLSFVLKGNNQLTFILTITKDGESKVFTKE